jgi:hypothetical protein
MRAALRDRVAAWRHTAEVIANAADGPDPEIAVAYLVDALRDLMRDMPQLDSDMRRALQASAPALLPVVP